MKIYAAIKIGEGKAEAGRVCDDRILVGNKVLEDGYYELEPDGSECIVAVADGVGGTGCGWKAATVALEEMATWDCTYLAEEDELRDALSQVNDIVIKASYEAREFEETAATLSVLIINRDHIGMIHLGDSRIYQKRNVQGHVFFKQLTEDQNSLRKWIQEEARLGNNTPIETLKNTHGWNHITSYLGMPEQKLAEEMVVEDYIIADGMFILTSDGIHDFLDKKTFRKLLAEEIDWEEKLQKIMGIARENGSHDDQSIIVVEYA